MTDSAKRTTAAIRLVLFDLDGTFADTAPDMAYALNQTLEQNGREPLPLETIRPHVSHGGVALIRLGFGIEPDDSQFPRLRQQFLDCYRNNLTRGTSLFSGIDQLITRLEQQDIGWGIVTNKPGWLTDPLMQQLALDSRAACVVSGDTTANAKPHPEPILHACNLHGTAPEQTLYIGDAERDIIAGNAAGTTTLVAMFGYIGAAERPETWQADGSISTPLQVLDWLA
jgi:phosphoglycolate phosphatase